MSLMIESMESRTLLSATVSVIVGDVLTLNAEAKTAKADAKIVLASIATDTKAVKVAFAAAKPTKAEKKVLSTFEVAEAVQVAKNAAKVTKILATGTADGVGLEALLKVLKAHPTSTATETKVVNALAKLQAVFSDTAVSTVESDVNAAITTLDADLNAVAAAVPSTQTAVTTAETGFGTDYGTLTTQATAIQTDLAQLATDLG